MKFPVLDAPLVYAGSDGPVSIYALVDPADMTVRYVGRTVHRGARLRGHISGPTSRAMRAWLKDLRADSKTPLMVELERVGIDDFPAAERRWIGHYRERGEIYNRGDGDPDGRPVGLTRPGLAEKVEIKMTGELKLEAEVAARLAGDGDVSSWLRGLIRNEVRRLEVEHPNRWSLELGAARGPKVKGTKKGGRKP